MPQWNQIMFGKREKIPRGSTIYRFLFPYKIINIFKIIITDNYWTSMFIDYVSYINNYEEIKGNYID